jgi:hypothetical protein
MNRQQAAELVQRYGKNSVPYDMRGVKQYTLEQDALTDLGQRMLDAAKKYEVNPDLQSFETTTSGVMLAGLREELLDVINYCAMIDELMSREGLSETSYKRWRMELVARHAFKAIIDVDLIREELGHHDNLTPYIDQLAKDSGMSHGE